MPRVQDTAEAAPDLLPPRRNIDVAIRGPEHPGGDGGGVVVARLRRHLCVHEPTRGLEVEHRDLGLEKRSAYPLTLAGMLTLEQRHQDPEGAVDPGAQVCNRNSGPSPALGPVARLWTSGPPCPAQSDRIRGAPRKAHPPRTRRCWRRRLSGSPREDSRNRCRDVASPPGR